MLCQECLGGQCRVWPGVVVLVNHLTLTRENRHHDRREHFFDVALCCDAPAASSAVVFEDDRLYTTSPGYGTPQHDGRPSPTVPLHNTRICEALTSTPPHPHTTVGSSGFRRRRRCSATVGSATVDAEQPSCVVQCGVAL